nr:hypothetical protein [uncultured Duganella sp.]
MENSIDTKINGTTGNSTGNSARDGVTQIGKDLRADAHAAIDRVADKVPPTADRLATRAHNGVDKVADGVESVSGTVDSVSERLAVRSKQVTESYKKLAESGRSHVRSSPAISVLIAAAAGYGISKLLNSRK